MQALDHQIKKTTQMQLHLPPRFSLQKPFKRGPDQSDIVFSLARLAKAQIKRKKPYGNPTDNHFGSTKLTISKLGRLYECTHTATETCVLHCFLISIQIVPIMADTTAAIKVIIG